MSSLFVGIKHAIVRRILQAYPISAQAYGMMRFKIIPEGFLQAIAQHFPENGKILDVGCGLGMFTIYFALQRPRCQFVGIDINKRRIDKAEHVANRLQIENVKFIGVDVSTYELPEHLNAAYCIDLLHHVSPAMSDRLLQGLFDRFEPGGVIVIKDINTSPLLKLYFTFILDFIMSPGGKFYYKDKSMWSSFLSQIGFVSVQTYQLHNILPYPHFLLIGRKPTASQ